MDIERFQLAHGVFSIALMNLYQELKNLLASTGNKLTVNIEDICDPQMKRWGVGGFLELFPNGDMAIQCGVGNDLEYTVSHELLHAYLKVNGFPNVTLNKPFKEYDVVHKIGVELHNLIEHKLIIQAQTDRKINIESGQTNIANRLINQIPTENIDAAHILHYVSWMIELGGKYQQYKEVLLDKYPRSSRMYDFVMALKYDDPFSTRRATIKLFREFERMTRVSLDLSSRIAIDFIPSKAQLDWLIPQVFYIENESRFFPECNKHLFLIAQSDSQLSFMYELHGTSIEESRKTISNCSLKKFYEITQTKYITR